jgi:hypothetical protein
MPVRIVHSIVSKAVVRTHFIVFIILDFFDNVLNLWVYRASNDSIIGKRRIERLRDVYEVVVA